MIAIDRVTGTGTAVQMAIGCDDARHRTVGRGRFRHLIALTMALAALTLAPCSAWCQSALAPELFPDQDAIRSDQAFVAQAYFFGTPSGNDITNVSLAGDVLTASFDPACAGTCPASTYAPHFVTLPALAQGSYSLKIVEASNASHVLAQFPLVVGSETQQPPRPAQMFTVPAQPAANRPFALHTFFPPYAYGWTPQNVSVAGSEITATVGPVGCAYGPCPPGIGIFYGPVVFAFPPLSAGTYTVRVVGAGSTTVYAQYSVVVGAGGAVTASTPALQPLMLWCLMALLALPALRILYKTSRSIRDSGHTHG